MRKNYTLFNIKFMRKLCVSLMALLAVFFVSCSTETDIIEENDGGKDVTLTISTSPLTKSLDDNQVGLKAPIDATKNLIVYFMDALSNTVSSYKLTTDQITAISGTGLKFTNLDPSVKSVYVVANVPSTHSDNSVATLPATAPGTALTAINTTVMNIYDQQKPNAESVVLANTSKAVVGIGSTTGNASNGNAQFTATVVLTPIVSRIQIAKVSPDATITSFDLEGIYIDNFYQNMSIGGELTIPIKAAAGESAKFKLSVEGAVTPYKANGSLFNEGADMEKDPGKVTSELLKPVKVYGYQFFPTSTGLSTVPYIILKITKVVGKTRTFPNSAYYVAVKAYKDGSNSFTTFDPGKIYTIANIIVSENNIVTDPTQSLINVTVNVTIAPWSEKALNPDFGY